MILMRFQEAFSRICCLFALWQNKSKGSRAAKSASTLVDASAKRKNCKIWFRKKNRQIVYPFAFFSWVAFVFFSRAVCFRNLLSSFSQVVFFVFCSYFFILCVYVVFGVCVCCYFFSRVVFLYIVLFWRLYFPYFCIFLFLEKDEKMVVLFS